MLTRAAEIERLQDPKVDFLYLLLIMRFSLTIGKHGAAHHHHLNYSSLTVQVVGLSVLSIIMNTTLSGPMYDKPQTAPA